MPHRALEFTPGRYYHVFNRTLNNELLFHNRANYLHLAKLMGRYKLRYQISIIAYCLMPNHYHFLLRQDKAALPKVRKRYPPEGSVIDSPGCYLPAPEYL